MAENVVGISRSHNQMHMSTKVHGRERETVLCLQEKADNVADILKERLSSHGAGRRQGEL